MLNQPRLALEWMLLLVGGMVLAWLAAQGDWTRRLDNAALDLATSFAREAPASDITIVAIDQRSLAELGAWPWPRSLHARLIDALHEAGAEVVLYDVLFVEPGDPQADAALAEAIARHGKVVLPFGFIAALNQAEGVAPEYPLPALIEAAAGLGHVEVRPDSDGALRRFALELSSEGEAFPHFVTAALALRDGGQLQDTPAQAEPWPVVPFNPANSYPTLPAAAVVKGEVPTELLRGRTILVGAGAQGMGDMHPVPTPAVALMSGVEVQANLLDAVRRGALIREMPAAWAAALAAAALVIQFLGFWKLSARAGLVLSAALILGLGAVSLALVPLAGVWVAPGAGVLVAALAYPLWSWRRLTVVSDYLGQEARALISDTGAAPAARGFDMVAQQVNLMRTLVGEVSGALRFVRSAIEASPDAIIVTDHHNCVLLLNQAAVHLFSAVPDPVGQSLADLYLTQNLAVDPETGEISLPDGRVFLSASAPLAGGQADEAGPAQVQRILALRDISQMRERQREHDELVQFLSHDMRSPQVAIMALTLSLGSDNAELARRIRAQAELTLGLADGFVQLARVRETGASFAAHDLSFLIHEAVDQAHALAARKRIAVRRDIPEEPVFADIDSSQIARLMANLIGNAVKYTPDDGEVIVALALPQPGEALITVRDNGPGLPPERLRDPFARFGARSGKDAVSAGLGLAYVKRVVDAHHGAITVRPGAAGGTIFEVRLPLEQSGPLAAQ